MHPELILISHVLCPYVQRAVISLQEKTVPYSRKDIDLAQKPDWFLKVSPLGKTPVLVVDGTAVFESSVILEFLEDTQIHPLHPVDPLKRAQHRAWIEYGSATLNDIAGLYNAKTQDAFTKKIADLTKKFVRLENTIEHAPYFDGSEFTLVDAAFGPVFRYFDVFDQINDFGILKNTPQVRAWRKALAERASVQSAVSSDYNQLLWSFLKNRSSHLSSLIPSASNHIAG